MYIYRHACINGGVDASRHAHVDGDAHERACAHVQFAFLHVRICARTYVCT